MPTAKVYRALLKACREVDGCIALKQELLRMPIPAVQAASAGLCRQSLKLNVRFDAALGVPVHLRGARILLPWRDVVMKHGVPKV